MTTVSGPADADTQTADDDSEDSVESDDTPGDDPDRASLLTPAHRLRDLTGSERWLAGLLGLAAVMPTVVAVIHFLPDWRPTGDPALMALRTLDVGTSRTPLLGQPSTSASYAGPDTNVNHPGALHFYLMAPFVRALGASAGMLLTSALVSVSMALVTLWVTYRRLGKLASVLAAVALSAALFGMGAGALLNPVSSSFSGVPLFAGAILAWAVLAGDIKLLPLAMGVLVFTAQVHLSVGPAVAFLCLVVAAGVAMRWRQDRRTTYRSALWSLAVVGVLMVPLFVQEFLGNSARGNLSALISYATDSESTGANLGFKQALWSLVHVLGLPPVLSNTSLSGWDLLPAPSVFTWVTAVGVVALLGIVAVPWARRRDPRTWLIVMAGLMALAGLINGSRIPAGLESGRVAFYHWVWPLMFFMILSLLLALADLLRAVLPKLTERLERGTAASGRIPVLAAGTVAVAVVLMAVPVINKTLDRPTNARGRMHMAYAGSIHDQVTDTILAAGDQVPTSGLLLISRGDSIFADASVATAVGLAENGIDVLFPRLHRTAVHDDRIAWSPEQVSGVLTILVHQTPPDGSTVRPPGELLGTVPLWSESATEAYELLRDQAMEAEEVVADPGAEPISFPRSPSGLQDVMRGNIAALQENLAEDPDPLLTHPEWVEHVMRYPLVEPELDPDALAQVYSTLTDDAISLYPTPHSIDVYLTTDPADVATIS